MRRATVVAATVAAAALAASASALAATLTSAAQVVSPATSPFTSCAASDPVPGNVLNSAVEPWITAVPGSSTSNPDVVLGWQQDRWGDPYEGGAHGIGNAYSFDGSSWAASPTIPYDTCSGGTAAGNGNWDRVSDVWLSAGPDGMLYESALVFNEFTAPSGITVSRSADGGQSWSTPVAVDTLPRASFTKGDDKESITADPYHPGTVYVVWDRYSSQKANYKPDGNALKSVKGPAYFSRSTDGGLTWSAPQAIYARDNGTIANQIIVLPGGTLADFFVNYIYPSRISGQFTVQLDEVRSSNQGRTWSGKPIVVSTIDPQPAFDPNTGNYIRDGAGLFDVALDPQSGRVYAVWQDGLAAGGSGWARVVLSASTDGGLTWSAPQLVNQVPSTQAFTPSVDVSANGTVAVTYYDFRNATTTTSSFSATDYWADLYTWNSTSSTLTFGSELRLTPSSFNAQTAPFAAGVMIGDYEGLTHWGNTFYSAFETTTSTPGQSQIQVAGFQP